MTKRPRMTAALRKALKRLALTEVGELEPFLRQTRTEDGLETTRVDPRTIETLIRCDLVHIAETSEGRRYALSTLGRCLSMGRPPETAPVEALPVITPTLDDVDPEGLPLGDPTEGDQWVGAVGHARTWYRTDSLTIDEWRARRFEYVGASEVSAVLGLNAYRGPLDVYQEKVGIVDGKIDAQVMRLGTLLEPSIIEFARREYDLEIFEVPQLLGHPDHDCLRCNLDGLAVIDGEEVVVEAKHAGARGSREHLTRFASSGEVIPGTSLATWFVQIQAQLVVTGLKRALLVALCDKDFHVVEVAPDPDITRLILGSIPAWWSRFVVPRSEPPATRADSKTIDRIFPMSDPERAPVELSENLAAMVVELRELRDKGAAVDARRDELSTMLKNALGKSETGTFDGESLVSWRTHERTSLDVAGIRETHPEIASQFTTKKTSRRFTF